jgi:hypothetical protein
MGCLEPQRGTSKVLLRRGLPWHIRYWLSRALSREQKSKFIASGRLGHNGHAFRFSPSAEK